MGWVAEGGSGVEGVRDLEGACRVKFTPGYTPGLGYMSHLWEPLRAEYRCAC
jgi:hypothetical protein